MKKITKNKSLQTGGLNMTMTLGYFISTEHLCDVVEWEVDSMNTQLTNLPQLSDSFMSTGTRILKRMFLKPCEIQATKD